MTITAPSVDAAVAAPVPARAVRAVLVDDHQLLAQSLSVALQMEGVECSVAELRDGDSLVRDVLALSPELVLLDLDLGGDLGDGSTLVAPFAEAGCRVLVVSASTDADQISRALENGAVGVLSKAAPFQQLLDTALAAARGEQVMSSVERCRLIDEARARRTARSEAVAPFERLSGREAQVLRAIAEGHSVGAIARSWVLSEATVRSQVRSILTKLGVSSQLEAVAAALRCGWL